MSHAASSTSARRRTDATCGAQIQIGDPDGNPSELHEAPAASTSIPSRLASAAVFLGATALAAPAAAQGVIGPGSGRTGASIAAVVALIGVVLGGRALARSRRPAGSGSRRGGAIAALVTGLLGTVLAGLHLATATGAIGTGSGRAGAMVAVVLGLIGMALGGLALSRSRRTG
jgi:hypothetical protein